MQAWIDIITNVGFPIAVCIALGFFIYKLWQQSKDREEALLDALNKATDVNRDCVNQLASMDSRLQTIEQVILDTSQQHTD